MNSTQSKIYLSKSTLLCHVLVLGLGLLVTHTDLCFLMFWQLLQLSDLLGRHSVVGGDGCAKRHAMNLAFIQKLFDI